MGMILGFGRIAILDHGPDLGKWRILDHDLGNGSKSMGMISNRWVYIGPHPSPLQLLMIFLAFVVGVSQLLGGLSINIILLLFFDKNINYSISPN